MVSGRESQMPRLRRVVTSEMKICWVMPKPTLPMAPKKPATCCARGVRCKAFSGSSEMLLRGC